MWICTTSILASDAGAPTVTGQDWRMHAGGPTEPENLPGRADVVVVGAGIVGLATARALQLARPGLNVVVVDKEARAAAHQSGHNSGVVHAGLYYRPGSRKALLCTVGTSRAARLV